jgi:hypothetical protein
MSAVGLSPEQVQDLADRLRGASAELAASRGAIGSALAVAWWSGGRADAFRNDWHGSLSPRLLRASEILEAAGAEAIRQRAEQLRTSDSGGGIGGVTGGGIGGGIGAGSSEVRWQDGDVGELIDFVAAAIRTYGGLKFLLGGPIPTLNNGLLGRGAVRLIPRLAPVLGSPGATLAFRVVGAAGSGYATYRGVQNLIDQGNPIDAFREDPGSYASDVAGTVFSASSTAFFIAPNPVTGTIMVVSGVVYLGTEIWDHWDEISDFAGDTWDLAGDLASDGWDLASDGLDVVGDVLSDGASGFADAVTFWN